MPRQGTAMGCHGMLGILENHHNHALPGDENATSIVIAL